MMFTGWENGVRKTDAAPNETAARYGIGLT